MRYTRHTTRQIERNLSGAKLLEMQSDDLRDKTLREANNLIWSAWTNADDTMLERGFKSWHENETTSQAWVNVFFASLECLIADGATVQVRRWFERRGITG